jgi:hypothetical protein
MIVLGTAVMVGELAFGLFITRTEKGRGLAYLGEIFKAYL